MSTQRPSVDVITGTIKSNFPTRISFQVTSKIDSRTILGEQGAEQLLGKGDMLYMPAGLRPQRIHGGFVEDAEVEAVVDFIKSQRAPEYVEGVTTDADLELKGSKDGDSLFDQTAMGGFGGKEDLYEQAVSIVRNDNKASTSYIQRRLGIGYNKAASIIERMEKEGVVTPADHVGRREVI
jgi:S-DNA-T family DNA segregation ATPase FtsK/SpoIIIE